MFWNKYYILKQTLYFEKNIIFRNKYYILKQISYFETNIIF